MQAPFELTEGLARLTRIIEALPPDSAHWNEAQNRFQFVDRLLTEVLGWEQPHIKVEQIDGAAGRSDYILGSPPKAILEAKREAKSFGSLPTGKPTAVRKLEPLLKASPSFEAAVHQVLQYCVIGGAQLAVVCNGPQLALFQALTPGYSPLEGECFFFDGFQAYIDNFPLLWMLMSPEGIGENRASWLLSEHRSPRIPSKASETIPEPNRFRYRNAFQENLRLLSSLLLEEVEDNPDLKSDFYRECYVPLEANNRHLLLSKKIIASRYKRVGDDGVSPSALDELARAGSKGQLVLEDAALQGAASSRPVVVIGDVGVGKTSFFENLYEKLDQSEKANTYFVKIDLGEKATLSADVKAHVLAAFPETLKAQYKVDIDTAEFANAVYHSQIKGFDKGVKGALKDIDPILYQKEKISFVASLVDRRDTHLHAAIGHLSRGRGKQIILVMDNADQRSFAIQQEAFLIAQELAATRNLIVFIALRPSTFIQSKMTGALSGYQHKILTISPPPADEVVQKRLTFAVRVAEGKVSPAALAGIRVQLGSVVSFLSATLRSIRTNEAIRFFLSNVTGGNTRGVIELVTSFFGSPNVDSRKIVEIEEREGNYRVPLHEFTKHALLGEYQYFNSQSSLVACNIFDVSSSDPREHFLASLLVSFLASNTGVRDNDGFVSGESVLKEMALHGFLMEQTRYALRRLAAKKLIETPHSHYRELTVVEGTPPEKFYYRTTSAGVYHVRFWTGSFPFLDATSIDTPIFDEAARSEVTGLAASFDITDRYQKTAAFRTYLKARWHAANIRAGYYDFSDLLEAQEESFRSVKLVVDRLGVGQDESFSRK